MSARTRQAEVVLEPKTAHQKVYICYFTVPGSSPPPKSPGFRVPNAASISVENGQPWLAMTFPRMRHSWGRMIPFLLPFIASHLSDEGKSRVRLLTWSWIGVCSYRLFRRALRMGGNGIVTAFAAFWLPASAWKKISGGVRLQHHPLSLQILTLPSALAVTIFPSSFVLLSVQRTLFSPTFSFFNSVPSARSHWYRYPASSPARTVFSLLSPKQECIR